MRAERLGATRTRINHHEPLRRVKSAKTLSGNKGVTSARAEKQVKTLSYQLQNGEEVTAITAGRAQESEWTKNRDF